MEQDRSKYFIIRREVVDSELGSYLYKWFEDYDTRYPTPTFSFISMKRHEKD